MKIIFKKILQYYLKYITKLVLILHRPTIVAIAGSTNKTFVKDKINSDLREQGIGALSNPKSFNTEIGLCLAVLNLPSGYNSYKDWLPVIFGAFLKLFRFNFPKILVLELGVSNPGDMKYLLSIVNVKIAVVTDITQRYMESFSDMDKLVEEYEYLVRKVKKTGLVVLNYDNNRIKNLERETKAQVEFFGFNEGADWRVIETRQEIWGQTTKISHNNIVHQYEVHRFGKHHIYALAISLIVEDYVKKEKKI